MISSYSDQELIDELTINRGFHVVAPDIGGARDILDFVIDELYPSEILENIHDTEIIDYLEHSDWVVLDKNETKLFLGNIPAVGGNLYKSECIDLFVELLEKNGGDFVYALLEPHKTF